MLTKQPDYTISELGYPQLQQHLFDDGYHKKCHPQAPKCSPSSSPSRLLPLRETLDDYNRRLLLLNEQSAKVANRQREWHDLVAQQKRQKNLRNEQQQQKQRENHNRGNQKCRDKAQGTQHMTTTTTTFVTCDLNSF